MERKLGPKEQQMRDQREARAKQEVKLHRPDKAKARVIGKLSTVKASKR